MNRKKCSFRFNVRILIILPPFQRRDRRPGERKEVGGKRERLRHYLCATKWKEEERGGGERESRTRSRMQEPLTIRLTQRCAGIFLDLGCFVRKNPPAPTTTSSHTRFIFCASVHPTSLLAPREYKYIYIGVFGNATDNLLFFVVVRMQDVCS